MGAYPVLKRFTVEEYLRLERRAPTKSEFLDGQMYAMAGGTGSHSDLIMNLAGLLQPHLKGGNCKVCHSDLRIAVTPTGPMFYADLTVSCGARQYFDKSNDCILNPVVIVEVLSKSTAKFDRETKASWYQRMPSARHILFIAQQSISVEHHFRTQDGEWRIDKLTDRAGTLKLSAIGADLPLDGIYDGLDFPSSATPAQ